MPKKLQWGILGTSFISETMVKAIQASAGGEVLAVAGRSEQKAQTFAQGLAIPHAYADYDDVLSNPDIDVVYIGLPAHLHAEWVIRCAKADKHILCEKPFTLNATEAEQVLAVLNASNVFCMEAQMMRCHPIMSSLKSLLTEEPIGQLMTATAHFSADILHLVNRETGNSILDLGCYPISLLRIVFGEPQSIQGLTNIDSAYQMVDRAHAVIQFPDACSATVTTSSHFGMYWQFRVFGEKGFLDISNLWSPDCDDAITIQLYDNAEPRVIVMNSAQNFYVDQINTVHRHVINGDREACYPAMTWQDSLLNMKALDLWQHAVNLTTETEATCISS
ncbi:MAG: Gfo/Idh/MocA family oxidoreductase [Coxiellaceae bacterium]|nr:Gfo/Idh/MocA family oxidoreductase [Coxiellaceae bacterium]